MNDSDQSTAAATGPHRSSGDNNRKPSFLSKLRSAFNWRAPTLREDLTEALEEFESSGEASFSDNERAILQNVLKLRETRIEDVMVPRADIEAVEDQESLATLVASFRRAGHSRLPIYQENLDNIVGFVHIKDMLTHLTAPNGKTSKRTGANGGGNGNGEKEYPIRFLSTHLKQKIASKLLVRKLLFVPHSMPVSDLLQQMQATRVHMAMVVDEYGGTDGLVTIEDLLEAVVGDIEDEHDDENQELVTVLDEDNFIADARVELEQLREIMGPEFDPSAYVEDADTLGGLIFDLVDRVPVRGEVISQFKGFEFEIMQADARRIRKVRIRRRRRVTRSRAGKNAADKQNSPIVRPDNVAAKKTK